WDFVEKPLCVGHALQSFVAARSCKTSGHVRVCLRRGFTSPGRVFAGIGHGFPVAAASPSLPDNASLWLRGSLWRRPIERPRRRRERPYIALAVATRLDCPIKHPSDLIERFLRSECVTMRVDKAEIQ